MPLVLSIGLQASVCISPGTIMWTFVPLNNSLNLQGHYWIPLFKLPTCFIGWEISPMYIKMPSGTSFTTIQKHHQFCPAPFYMGLHVGVGVLTSITSSELPLLDYRWFSHWAEGAGASRPSTHLLAVLPYDDKT